MTRLIAEISISLDGFAAGPDQGEENPLGIGGEQLHEWAIATRDWREAHDYEGGEENADSERIAEAQANKGAGIMGRNMFGPDRGPWGDDPWEGWWGDEPP